MGQAPTEGSTKHEPVTDRIALTSPDYRLWFERATLEAYRQERPAELALALERRGIHPDRDEGGPGGVLYGMGTNGLSAVEAASMPPVRVTFLGSCLTQFAEDAVHGAGRRHHVDALISHRWLGKASAEALADDPPDVVVVQTGASGFLEPILRASGPVDPVRAAEGVGAIIAGLVASVDRSAPEAVVIVHSIARPAIWPPTASADTWARAWDVLNGRIVAAAQNIGAAVLDEGELAYVHGATNLFDDLRFPWAHHGGATDVAVEAPNQLESMHRILADALWDTLDAHRSPAFKAIITDLDGVLWPGVAAESGFGWLREDGNTSWIHRGVQEALQAYERSGLVLATLSRGDEAVTLGLWESAADQQSLRPDSFALHSIDWRPKATRMAEVLDALQITPDRAVYIDDHPVERAAVQAAFPTMRVLGDDVGRLREQLLGSRRLQRSVVRGTGVSRTVTTRAAIQRERDRVRFDEQAFRAHLGVRLTVRPATSEDLPRVQELVERTTQFSLGNGRAVAIGDLADPSLSVRVLKVADRYSDYGLVGVSLIDVRLAALSVYAVSCRVLGLEVSDALLATHLDDLGMDKLIVDLVSTSRNGVVRDALARWGQTHEDGIFRINRKDRTDAMDHAAGRTH